MRCEIFVPEGASIAKAEATRSYGATVRQTGETVDAAVAAARTRADETGMAFIHPFDDLAIVAGQATLGLELVEDVPDLRRVVVPVGGGGLASGVAIAVKQADPTISVVGVQIDACAPYANQAVAVGPITTLADGIAVKAPGLLTRPLVDAWVDDIVTVEEDVVADAMMFLMERAKLFVEGGGAVGVAALLERSRVAPARAGVTAGHPLRRERGSRRAAGPHPPGRDAGRATTAPFAFGRRGSVAARPRPAGSRAPRRDRRCREDDPPR